jgi:RNA polymerase sigma-70 factor (ECF subfamily)
MQELVLIQPGRTAETDLQRGATEAVLRREFEERFKAWLVRITFRLALDRAKSSHRRQHRETLWSRPERQPAPPTAEDLAAANQFRSRLDHAVDQPPEKQRLVLLLSAIEGHSLEEVAALLNIPIGTVKSRLFFARKQLAEKLR